MKIRNTLAASTLVLATAFAGIASANLSTGSIGTDVQSAAGSGHVSVSVKDGIAYLFGGVESRTDSNAAELAAANFDGVESVVNRIYVSN